MSGGPNHTDVDGEGARARSAGKGPLILAKLIVSYLDKKREGSSREYSELVGKLGSRDVPTCDMSKWLQGLKLCVSHLDEDCVALVAATLGFPWYFQSETLVGHYLEYLENLLSAQVCHMENTLSSLTQALLKPSTLLEATKSEMVEQAYSNIHRGLRTLLETVPRATAHLVPALASQYPFRNRGADMQELAVRNCLHVLTYCPTVSEDILFLLLKKMVNIDAEIRLEDDSSMELASDVEEDETQFQVDMEQGQVIGGVAPTTVGETSLSEGCPGDKTTPIESCRGDEAMPPILGPSLSKRRVMRDSMSEILDIKMTILQSFLKSTCLSDGQLIVEEAVMLLQTLLKIFSDVILPTHSISHVQFLIFYLTSFHKEFPGVFLDFLWKRFQDINTSVLLRQTAATYMASYIARSKFVSMETVRLCLAHMMEWLHQYLDVCDVSGLPSLDRHGPFFSLCQSIFYIFIFRHKSLVEPQDGLSFLQNLNFERIIFSKLNPLRVCLPSVVEKFSKLASQHELAFCYTIVEANKRLMLLLAASMGTQSLSTNHLDCFFPFDPYLLHRSSEVIQPIYHEWQDDDDTKLEEETERGKQDDHFGEPASSPALSSSPLSCLSVSLGHSCDEATPTYCEPHGLHYSRHSSMSPI